MPFSVAIMKIVEDKQKVVKNLGDMLSNGDDEQEHVSMLDDNDGIREFMRTLPANVKHRVRYLKRLQVDGIQLEVELYRAVHQLEIEFAAKSAHLYAKV